MSDIFRGFEIARRVAEAIAAGRIEAAAVGDMTDEQLAEFDKDVYAEYLASQKEREDLLAEPTPPEKPE